jgi:hypothetical protein
MNLNQWAIEWGIPYAAVQDLQWRMGLEGHAALGLPPPPAGKSEAYVSSLLRLEASQQGGRLFRNNVGATQDETGRLIRFGLANESKQMNKMLKSADYIGILPRRVTQEMVGQIHGIFLSREAKEPDWVFDPNDEHQAAQKRWNDLILSLGGDAGFATSAGTIK